MRGLSDAALDTLHRQIGDSLLRPDADASFAAKLSRLIEVAGEIARRPGARAAVPLVPETGNPASAIAQFAAFHRRVPRPLARAGPASGGDDDPNRVDFHQMLTALGEYPELLKRLGLVIDLNIDAAVIPASVIGRVRRMRLQPKFADGGLASAFYTPNTLYLLDLRTTGSPMPFPIFAAAPQQADQPSPPASLVRDLEIVGGLLNLGLPAADGASVFGLVQIDLDGAATKILNAVNAITLDEQRPTHPIDNPDTSSVPSFRTSGVSLVRSGHASALVEDIRRSEDHEQALKGQQLTDFYAEDLVRGYRVDVRRFPEDFPFGGPGQTPSSPPWLSLHQRAGTYVVGQNQAAAVMVNATDEGFIQPAFVQDSAPTTKAAGSAAAGDPANPIYVPESMCHWKGWSLAAPPPGTPVGVIPPSDSAAQNAPVGLPQLNIDFSAVPGSLPRLRFGSFYQVRVRTVDLAGNGLSATDADGIAAALAAQGSAAPILPDRPQAFRYRRFEPIPPPELVLRHVLTEGEAVDVMVIRSNGSTTAGFVASLDDSTYNAQNERHIVPPKAAWTMVESHGRLDGALGPTGNSGAFYNICQRERGTLDDGFIIDIRTGNQDPLPDQVVTDPATGIQTTIRNGILPVTLPGATTSRYSVHYEPQLAVPYLPDPMARGAALFGLPDVANTTGQLDDQGNLIYSGPEAQVLALPATQALGFVTKIDFGPSGNWPNLAPFRLILDELGSDDTPVQPQWSNDTRELTVRLAPGNTCVAWISSYPPPADVDLLGLYAWLRSQAAPSTDDKFFLNMAQHGALSLLSPPRKLTLVHAVQQPVDSPLESSDDPLRAVKFANDTTAYIGGTFQIHSLSTIKLDLVAEWEEQGEGPDDTNLRTMRTHVFEVAIPPLPRRPRSHGRADRHIRPPGRSHSVPGAHRHGHAGTTLPGAAGFRRHQVSARDLRRGGDDALSRIFSSEHHGRSRQSQQDLPEAERRGAEFRQSSGARDLLHRSLIRLDR